MADHATPQSRTTFNQLLTLAQKEVNELFPWDVEELMEANTEILLLDIREPYEYKAMRIKGSLNVPRGVLESACEWAYDETVPELVEAREKKILVICRSGNRSLLAAQTMQIMGYQDVSSLKTGLKGWNEYDLPLVNDDGEVDVEVADVYHLPKINSDQLGPGNE